jgi:TPR repeat protein
VTNKSSKKSDVYSKDFDMAQHFAVYQRSAESGDVRGQFILGHVYGTGAGVTKDLEQAFFWFHKAALQGHALAQLAIGIAYSAGLGLNLPPTKVGGVLSQSCRSKNVLNPPH